MTTCSICVAAYDALVDAAEDWRTLVEADAASEISLVDGAVVETNGSSVVALHHWTDRRHGGGIVASAIVALLEPASVMLGAVAGGIGAELLATSSRALTRREVLGLGEVLDTSMHSIVSVLACDRPPEGQWRLWLHSRDFTLIATQLTVEDIEWAMLVDRAGD